MKVRVIRPWFGMKAGQVVEVSAIHPAIADSVEILGEPHLEPATPGTVEQRPDNSDPGEQIDGQGLEPVRTKRRKTKQ